MSRTLRLMSWACALLGLVTWARADELQGQVQGGNVPFFYSMQNIGTRLGKPILVHKFMAVDASGNPASSGGSSTPTGTAGSPNAAVMSVQGISGGTPQPVTVSSGAVTVSGTVTNGAGTANMGGVSANTSAITGGLTTNNRLVSSAATVNSTVVKATAGRVYRITGYNNSAAIKYLKFYNLATAPVVGTTAVFYTFPLPVGAFSFDGANIGFFHATGIGFGITGAVADNDTTALAAGDITALTVWYQ